MEKSCSPLEGYISACPVKTWLPILGSPRLILALPKKLNF